MRQEKGTHKFDRLSAGRDHGRVISEHGAGLVILHRLELRPDGLIIISQLYVNVYAVGPMCNTTGANGGESAVASPFMRTCLPGPL